MKILMLMLLGTVSLFAEGPVKAGRVYEMRTYFANPGKLEALHARFRDHTCKLFEKHGMENIGYWVPVYNPQEKLVYLLAYADRAAREASWKAFQADPAWKGVVEASHKDGVIVARVESAFLTETNFSPEVKAQVMEPARVFELRTYTTTKGNLGRLDGRFRDHTIGLFSKHGMGHIGYWHLMADQKGAEETLVYLLAHRSAEAGVESFAKFRADPVWIEAKAASEKEAGGSLTVPDGVKSEILEPTDYSPIR